MKSSLLFGAVAAVVCFAPVALVQPVVLAKSATEVNDIAQAIAVKISMTDDNRSGIPIARFADIASGLGVETGTSTTRTVQSPTLTADDYFVSGQTSYLQDGINNLRALGASE
jgi:hypothetical protein